MRTTSELLLKASRVHLGLLSRLLPSVRLLTLLLPAPVSSVIVQVGTWTQRESHKGLPINKNESEGDSIARKLVAFY